MFCFDIGTNAGTAVFGGGAEASEGTPLLLLTKFSRSGKGGVPFCSCDGGRFTFVGGLRVASSTCPFDSGGKSALSAARSGSGSTGGLGFAGERFFGTSTPAAFAKRF